MVLYDQNIKTNSEKYILILVIYLCFPQAFVETDFVDRDGYVFT